MMPFKLPDFLKHRTLTAEHGSEERANSAHRVPMTSRAISEASFSQCGEDRIISFVLGMLGMQTCVSYADIGAANPEGHNNTYLFYIQGGAGVIVEADPSYSEAYQEFRPRDKVESVAIVPQRLRSTGWTNFFIAGDPGWSSASAEHADLGRKLGKGEVKTVLTVPCMTVNQLLEKHFVGKDIHLISLDIEGFDLEVIQEIDFQRFRP